MAIFPQRQSERRKPLFSWIERCWLTALSMLLGSFALRGLSIAASCVMQIYASDVEEYDGYDRLPVFEGQYRFEYQFLPWLTLVFGVLVFCLLRWRPRSVGTVLVSAAVIAGLSCVACVSATSVAMFQLDRWGLGQTWPARLMQISATGTFSLLFLALADFIGVEVALRAAKRAVEQSQMASALSLLRARRHRLLLAAVHRSECRPWMVVPRTLPVATLTGMFALSLGVLSSEIWQLEAVVAWPPLVSASLPPPRESEILRLFFDENDTVMMDAEEIPTTKWSRIASAARWLRNNHRKTSHIELAPDDQVKLQNLLKFVMALRRVGFQDIVIWDDPEPPSALEPVP